MSRNFWQDKWLHGQYHRTEAGGGNSNSAMPDTSPAPAVAAAAKRPSDPNQLAKLIVSVATDNPPEAPKTKAKRSPALGKRRKKKPTV